MNIRNSIESKVLKKLGGTDEQCLGTQIEILNDIVEILGGTVTNKTNRNKLFEDILLAS